MFQKHACNIKPIDSILRVILALSLIILAFYYNNYYILLLSLVLAYTAMKKYCPTYALFKINERFSVKNYYLSYLPKHNPSAVFIFSLDGKIVFENKVADENFEHINSVQDLNILKYSEMIINNDSKTIFYDFNKRNYQIELIGVNEEHILLAYFSDVTEIFELNDAIEDTQREVIYAMGEIGETRSKETGNHVKRVALYSYELAKLYGMDEAEASKLQMASPMHDIGKVGIADAILNAPRKLTSEEFIIMKTHAELGYNMLKTSNKPILQAAAIVANEHHEKYDGSGYPNAKVGDNIHIYGRITAIADVFDALGSQRVYKKAWELERILELFKDESGKHFDPNLMKFFLNNLDIFLDIRNQFKDV